MWHAFRAHYRLLFVAALLVFLPVSLIDAGMHGIGEIHLNTNSLTAGHLLVAGAKAILILLVAMIATAGEEFYNGVVCTAVGQWRKGAADVSLAGVLRTVPYKRLIVADVLFTVMIGIGLGLLIVPGVVFFTWFSLAAPVIKIEGRSVIASFRRSRQLVRGNFLRVTAVVWPLALLIDLPSEIVQKVDSTFLGSPFLADWLAATAITVATAPLFALGAVTTAYRLLDRERDGAQLTSRGPSQRSCWR